MKKLVLETTAPFQGLPELVAYDEGLFEQEGLDGRMGRPRAGRREEGRDRRHQPEGRQSVRQPRQAVRAGQGRHVQRLRMGQLLPRAGHQHRQPPARPPRHRDLFRPGGGAEFAGLHAAAARRPHHRRAVLFRHPLHRAAHAGRLPAARPDQALPRAQRLALSARRAAEGRGRGHHLDRAARHAGREEGLPHHLLGLLPRHRGRVRPGRRRDLRGLQPRGARGGAAHQRRQARLSALFHRLSRQEGSRRSRRSRSRTCARAGWWSAIRRRSRSTRCSAPTTGSRAGACWRRPPRRSQLVNMDVQRYAHQAAE